MVLRRYLYSMNHDIEDAKKLIIYSYSMRAKHPKIFYDRDPLNEKIRKIHNVV